MSASDPITDYHRPADGYRLDGPTSKAHGSHYCCLICGTGEKEECAAIIGVHFDAAGFDGELARFGADPAHRRMWCASFIMEMERVWRTIERTFHRDLGWSIEAPPPFALFSGDGVMLARRMAHGCKPEGVAGISVKVQPVQWIDACDHPDRAYWCMSCQSQHEALRTQSTATEAKSYVYAIRRGTDGPIKIGVTTNLASRLATLQTATPEPLNVVALIPGGTEVERMIHLYLREHRIRGEWFAPSEHVLRVVRELRGAR
jgi:hypothetical protein